MRNPIDQASKSLEEISELNQGDLKEGEDLAEEVIEISESIESLLIEEENKRKFSRIISKFESHSSKLSKDLKRSGKGSLGSDWRKFARRDLSKLIDEALALQEFLSENRSELRKRFNEREHGIDLRELAKELEREEILGRVTRSKFSSKVEDMDEEEIEDSTEEMSDRLDRISKWLFALEEVRSEVGE